MKRATVNYYSRSIRKPDKVRNIVAEELPTTSEWALGCSSVGAVIPNLFLAHAGLLQHFITVVLACIQGCKMRIC